MKTLRETLDRLHFRIRPKDCLNDLEVILVPADLLQIARLHIALPCNMPSASLAVNLLAANPGQLYFLRPLALLQAQANSHLTHMLQSLPGKATACLLTASRNEWWKVDGKLDCLLIARCSFGEPLLTVKLPCPAIEDGKVWRYLSLNPYQINHQLQSLVSVKSA